MFGHLFRHATLPVQTFAASMDPHTSASLCFPVGIGYPVHNRTRTHHLSLSINFPAFLQPHLRPPGPPSLPRGLRPREEGRGDWEACLLRGVNLDPCALRPLPSQSTTCRHWHPPQWPLNSHCCKCCTPCARNGWAQSLPYKSKLWNRRLTWAQAALNIIFQMDTCWIADCLQSEGAEFVHLIYQPVIKPVQEVHQYQKQKIPISENTNC